MSKLDKIFFYGVDEKNLYTQINCWLSNPETQGLLAKYQAVYQPHDASPSRLSSIKRLNNFFKEITDGEGDNR
jgi:hypothetical protein